MMNFKNMLNYANKIPNNRKYNTLIPWAIQNEFKSFDVVKANKCDLYIKDNNKVREVKDYTSGLMVTNLGHNNKYIMNGFMEYYRTGIAYINSQFKTDQRELLSDRLINITNNHGGKVFYTNGGADANETAVFIANEYQQLMNNKKKKILSFNTCFHGGSTIGATLLTSDGREGAKKSHYSLNFESTMENPSLEDDGKSSLEQINNLFEGGDTAAIIIEGSSGSARCIPYPDGYLDKLEKICRKHDVLIICDEVMSGWGRTGNLFGYNNSNIKPDIITTSKALTSGYIPLGAVIISEKVASIYNNKMFVHGLTYFAHPLSCTIANKCIDQYLENDQQIVKQAKEKGKLLNKLGKNVEKRLDIVKEYRNNGLLGCFELNTNNEKLLKNVSTNLFNANVFCFRRENRIFTAPPLIITAKEITDTTDIIEDVFQKIE